jgi:hypothetical protein
LAVGQFNSWNQADEYCSALSTPHQSHLVNIDSIDVQQLVATLLSALGSGEKRFIGPRFFCHHMHSAIQIVFLPHTISAGMSCDLYKPKKKQFLSPKKKINDF